MPDCDPEKFVNRNEELEDVKQKVTRLVRGTPFAPHERVFHFVGPSGIGKSCLLEKCCEIKNDLPECIPVLIKLQSFRRGYEDFTYDFLAAVDKEFSDYLGILTGKRVKGIQYFGAEVAKKVKNNLKNKVLILLLDEIDFPARAELQAIEDHLLEKLLHDNEHVVLITAGRVPAALNDFALRPSATNKRMLSVFDLKITSKQLEKLRLDSVPLADKIQELGGGVPGNSAKLVTHVIGDPPGIVDELRAIQALLADVKREIAEFLHPLLDAVCVLQSFFPEDVTPLVRNHPELGMQWNETRIKEVFLELKQIQIGPGGLINWNGKEKSWAMDEPIRMLFERELQMRDRELWRKLHCTAYQIYRQWAKKYNSQLYKGKAAYHEDCLQSAGYSGDDLEVRVEL